MADAEARVAITASDQTAAAFKSANRNMQEFAGRTASGAQSAELHLKGLRRTLGDIFTLYGTMRLVNFFAAWLKDAAEAKSATDTQKAAVSELKGAYDGLHEAVQQSGLAIIEAFGDDTAAGMNRIKSIITEINDQFAALKRDHPSIANALVAAAEFPITGGFAVKKLIEGPAKFTTGGGIGGPSIDDLTGVSGKLDQSLRPFPAFVPAPAVKNAGQALSPELAEFIDQLKEGAALTEKMRTEVEQQTDEWHRVQLLLKNGVIDEETAKRFRDSLLQPIEVTAKRIKELKPETLAWAKTLSQGMKQAFADWLVDGEFKFKEFLKRLAAQWIASEVFKGIEALIKSKEKDKGDSGGGTLLGVLDSVFGGGRALGGPVAAGMSYLVGERGPEIFTPRAAGAITPNGGGGGIQQTFHVQAGLPPQWEAQLAAVTQIAAQAAYEAVNNRLSGRR